MKCSVSVCDSLLEDFVCSIFLNLNSKEDHHLGKYVSRDHRLGNLIFPSSVAKSQSKLEEILKNSSGMKFLVDDIKTNLNLNLYQVYLNQNSVFRTSLQAVLDCGTRYGVNSLHGPKLEIIDPEPTFPESLSASSYRLYLCSVVLQRFLHSIEAAKGFNEEVKTSERRSPGHESKKIFIHNHRTRVKKCNHTINVVCRTEICELNGAKNIEMSVKDYKILREKDIRRDDGFKDNDSSKIIRIVDACIIFDLLTNKLSMPVNLKLNEDRIVSRNSSSKGAVFVLYTYARLAAIINKFEEFVLKNNIEVPSIVEADFSILTNAEEKVILYNYILMFPVLAKEIWTELINKGEFLVNKLCLFLAQFSSVISKYYRSTRVLMTTTPNLFPLMFSRIYLLRASLQVLCNGLHYLTIEPLPEM